MSAKSILKGGLLVFALGSLVILLVKETSPWARTSGAGAQAPTAKANPAGESRKVIAYYFHTNYRCPTCQRIEAYSREAINFGFDAELKAGRLELRVVNYELPENQHFAQDYKLFTKSLVLVRIQDGQQVGWTNLERIWELNSDYDAFMRYVQGEIRKYLEKS